MSLPKAVQPVFTMTVDELNKKFKYRPFVMRENRAILNARVIGDDITVRDTFEQVVQACLMENKNEKVDVPSLPAHLVDYMFLQIFTKSETDMLPVTYTCRNQILVEEEFDEVDEDGNDKKVTREVLKECGHQTRNHLDLKQVKIVYPDGYKEKKAIKVDDEITLNIDYPKSSSMRELYTAHDKDEDDNYLFTEEQREQANLKLIFDSIVNVTKISNGVETITYPNDEGFSIEDFQEWLDESPKHVTTELLMFYQVLPIIHLKTNMQCINPDCLHKSEYEFIGVRSFLDLS